MDKLYGYYLRTKKVINSHIFVYFIFLLVFWCRTEYAMRAIQVLTAFTESGPDCSAALFDGAHHLRKEFQRFLNNCQDVQV